MKKKDYKLADVYRKLIELGYELFPYANKIELKKITTKGVKKYAKKNKINGKSLKSIKHILAAEIPEALRPANFIDLRSLQPDPPSDERRYKLKRNGKVYKRDIKKITGVCLHQTSILYGISKRQTNEAGGNQHLALHNRGLKVACHGVVFGGEGADIECGHALLVNPLRWYVWQADTMNSISLGLEIEGDYPGLMRSRNERVLDHIIKAAREALKALVNEARKEGAPIKYIWAHRQSSAMRRDDPGEEIWRRVALEYGVAVLGLETQPGRTWGNGKTIPKIWDEINGIGKY